MTLKMVSKFVFHIRTDCISDCTEQNDASHDIIWSFWNIKNCMVLNIRNETTFRLPWVSFHDVSLQSIDRKKARMRSPNSLHNETDPKNANECNEKTLRVWKHADLFASRIYKQWGEFRLVYYLRAINTSDCLCSRVAAKLYRNASRDMYENSPRHQAKLWIVQRDEEHFLWNKNLDESTVSLITKLRAKIEFLISSQGFAAHQYVRDMALHPSSNFSLHTLLLTRWSNS